MNQSHKPPAAWQRLRVPQRRGGARRIELTRSGHPFAAHMWPRYRIDLIMYMTNRAQTQCEYLAWNLYVGFW